MAHDPRDDRDLLAEAAREAGALALAHFRTDVEVVEKPRGQGPVTEADRAVNAFLHERLQSARPDYGWLSEESPDTPERLAAERVFIVDPIDGTRAFIEGHDGWSISLGIAERGQVVAAAVHLPARGQAYAAALGAGAVRDGEAIRASGRDALDGARMLAARPQLAPELWPGGVPPVERSFRSSLAWRLCLVAEGRFDAMITLRDAWEWDIAAGSLIAAEAGALVTDGQGASLRFNRPRPLNPGVIAAPGALHAGLIALRRPPKAL